MFEFRPKQIGDPNEWRDVEEARLAREKMTAQLEQRAAENRRKWEALTDEQRASILHKRKVQARFDAVLTWVIAPVVILALLYALLSILEHKSSQECEYDRYGNDFCIDP